MSSSTSYTGTNVRTVFLFETVPPERPPPGVRRDVVAWARFAETDPHYPSPAIIEFLTRKIIAAIIRAEMEATEGRN